ncbi:MAG: hypothetical protein WCK67_06375 [bacterium]
MNKCSDNPKIICQECKLPLEMDFLGKKCPRCNNFIFANACENCIKKCRKK